VGNVSSLTHARADFVRLTKPHIFKPAVKMYDLIDLVLRLRFSIPAEEEGGKSDKSHDEQGHSNSHRQLL